MQAKNANHVAEHIFAYFCYVIKSEVDDRRMSGGYKENTKRIQEKYKENIRKTQKALLRYQQQALIGWLVGD